MIEYNAAGNIYKVFFPGQPTTTISGNLADGHNYAQSNGDWLRVLEKAYGQWMYNLSKSINGEEYSPYDYIKEPDLPSTGVEVLTGHSTDVDWFWSTRDSTTRQKLINAFANDKVVTAQIFGGSSNDAMAKKNGLVADHIYTVVAYDATNNRVRLYNPHHENPMYNPGGGMIFRGMNDAENIGSNGKPQNNGYFWMNLPEFTERFSAICYEE